MILQALAEYYEALARRGEIARPGWGAVKVSYALEIDPEGRLVQVLPLKSEVQKGNKTVLEPRKLKLPAPTKRTVAIDPNFLWDNSAYLLGFDGKGKPQRAGRCFEAARELHLSLLGGVDDPFARAICAYFSSWDVFAARTHPQVAPAAEELEAGANLTFLFRDTLPGDSPALALAWQRYYDGAGDESPAEVPAEPSMRCLVSGELTLPMPTHPAVKGVRDAQSSGAALVSFNTPAACSYGREQNLNAPVSKRAAFAYTTALNHLLADNKHVRHFGDTTVVYWAQGAESGYQDVFSRFLEGGDDENLMTDEDLDGCMKALAQGRPLDWAGVTLRPDNRFYVLGLAPNAARVSVRFFLRDGFGHFAEHIQRHYQALDIVSDGRSRWKYIPLWALLRETVNESASKKDGSPQLSGDTMRAILTGCNYPATLYQQTMLRIRAEQTVTRGRAAIIKAYLTRTIKTGEVREALTVELNEKTTYQPYVLGRLFALLSEIQERASGVTSIKDKYFSSACATPAVVFPRVLDLADKHLKKLDGGLRVHYERQRGELLACVTATYPAHHSLYDQGVFQLGYYHQTQKRYEKKDKAAPTAVSEEMKEVQ